jgi:hypothetical protein
MEPFPTEGLPGTMISIEYGEQVVKYLETSLLELKTVSLCKKVNEANRYYHILLLRHLLQPETNPTLFALHQRYLTFRALWPVISQVAKHPFTLSSSDHILPLEMLVLIYRVYSPPNDSLLSLNSYKDNLYALLPTPANKNFAALIDQLKEVVEDNKKIVAFISYPKLHLSNSWITSFTMKLPPFFIAEDDKERNDCNRKLIKSAQEEAHDLRKNIVTEFLALGVAAFACGTARDCANLLISSKIENFPHIVFLALITPFLLYFSFALLQAERRNLRTEQFLHVTSKLIAEEGARPPALLFSADLKKAVQGLRHDVSPPPSTHSTAKRLRRLSAKL